MMDSVYYASCATSTLRAAVGSRRGTELAKRLEASLHEVLAHSRKRRKPTPSDEFQWSVLQDLVGALAMCDHRKLLFDVEGFEGVLGRLSRIAEKLRAASVPQLEAIDPDELFSLADMLGKAARLFVHTAVGKEIEDILREARPIAADLKDRIQTSLVDLDYTASARAVVRDAAAKLALESRRLLPNEDTHSTDYAEVVSTASEIGNVLLQLSYYDLESISPSLPDELRDIGRVLLPLRVQRHMSYDECEISEPIAESLRRLKNLAI